MGIFNFFKKEKEVEKISPEKLAFSEIKNWLEKEKKENDFKEKEVLILIKDKIRILNSNLKEKIRILNEIDIESKKKRHYEHEFTVQPGLTEREWYLVKAYGRQHPVEQEYVDIMVYAELCEREKHYEYVELDQLAFSNPFYFV